MKTFRQYSHYALLSTLFVFTVFVAGCGGGGGGSSSATAIAPPPILPIIIATTPIIDDVNVIINRSITALFDKALDPATVSLSTFTLVDTNTSLAVIGSVSYNSNTMIFDPIADLNVSTEYTATITTGVKNLEGRAMASNYVWSFTTGTTTDIIPPTITSTNPSAADTNASINISVSALFNEVLDPTTVTLATFSLVTTSDGSPVVGTVHYDSNTMIFNPAADLNASTEYTATISTGVTDLSGNALAVAKVWSFTTGTTTTIALLPVDLGTSGSFAILTKTGISTTGTTAIIGDIGVSPAALTYITGFGETLVGTYATSPLVTGKIYAANMAPPTPAKMTTAVSDMETAYTNAAGRTNPNYTELGAGNITGMTLAPGLYKWGTGLLINGAGVTLSGSATDVWIFQISGDLTLASAASINLAGGALAKNVFWQVAGGVGVYLQTTSNLKGVVLAQKAIVVNTGAIVNGRLLAQSAVTLDANTITQP